MNYDNKDNGECLCQFTRSYLRWRFNIIKGNSKKAAYRVESETVVVEPNEYRANEESIRCAQLNYEPAKERENNYVRSLKLCSSKKKKDNHHLLSIVFVDSTRVGRARASITVHQLNSCKCVGGVTQRPCFECHAISGFAVAGCVLSRRWYPASDTTAVEVYVKILITQRDACQCKTLKIIPREKRCLVESLFYSQRQPSSLARAIISGVDVPLNRRDTDHVEVGNQRSDGVRLCVLFPHFLFDGFSNDLCEKAKRGAVLEASVPLSVLEDVRFLLDNGHVVLRDDKNLVRDFCLMIGLPDVAFLINEIIAKSSSNNLITIHNPAIAVKDLEISSK